MNVLFLALEADSSGPRDDITYNFIAKEMVGLVDMGHQIFYFSDRLNEEVRAGVCYLGALHMERLPRSSILFHIVRRANFYFRAFFVSPRKAWWAAKVNVAVSEIIREKGIQLVHSHFLAPAGTAGCPASMDCSVPTVSTLRGAELYNEPEMKYGAMRDSLYRCFATNSAKQINIFTVPNRSMIDLLTRTLGVCKERVKYLPNGFEPPTVMSKCSKREGKLKLIAIGRLIERKNYRVLLEAMVGLNASDVELEIVGQGPLKQALLKIIADEGLAEYVNISAEVSKGEIFRKLSEADCLIHPSFIEGLPNVVLESLAVGTPCVVSNIGAHIGVIRNYENGFIFDPNDSSRLRSIISDLIGNPNCLQNMRSECLRTAKQYPLIRKLKAYTNLYENLVDK